MWRAEVHFWHTLKPVFNTDLSLIKGWSHIDTSTRNMNAHFTCVLLQHTTLIYKSKIHEHWWSVIWVFVLKFSGIMARILTRLTRQYRKNWWESPVCAHVAKYLLQVEIWTEQIIQSCSSLYWQVWYVLSYPPSNIWTEMKHICISCSIITQHDDWIRSLLCKEEAGLCHQETTCNATPRKLLVIEFPAVIAFPC